MENKKFELTGSEIGILVDGLKNEWHRLERQKSRGASYDRSRQMEVEGLLEKLKTENKKLYWYEYKLRGCSPGCQPGGFQEVDHSWGRFGAVAYDRSLLPEEIKNYELEPLQ